VSACGPIQRNGIVALDRAFVNAANVATPMAVTGVAQADVTSVSLAVKDSTGATTTLGPITPTGGTWSASVNVAGLAEGTVTLTPTVTNAGGSFAGAAMTVVKDVTRPAPPVASLSPGTYAGARSVSLGDDDSTAAIRFTTAGNAPGAGSPLFTAWAMVRTARSEATCPDAWPPMPSHTR
jgi:hypothetical protein